MLCIEARAAWTAYWRGDFWWNAVSLFCWAGLWPGGVWRHKEASLSLHRASGRRKSCFHLPLNLSLFWRLCCQWAGAARAAGRSRQHPWAGPVGFVTAQIQCPAWGLRNHFHMFYQWLQFPFVFLLGSSNRALVALIPTWGFCLLGCFLPSSMIFFFFLTWEEKNNAQKEIGPLFLWGNNIYQDLIVQEKQPSTACRRKPLHTGVNTSDQ